MKIVHSYEEPFQFSFFVPDSGTARARYFYSTDTNATLAVYDNDHTLQKLPLARDGYDGYVCLFDDLVEGGCTYNYDAIFQYQPQQITVSTQIKSIQLLTRTITLSLGEVPKLHQKLITDTAKRDTNTFGTITAKTDDENHLTLFLHRLVHHPISQRDLKLSLTERKQLTTALRLWRCFSQSIHIASQKTWTFLIFLCSQMQH